MNAKRHILIEVTLDVSGVMSLRHPHKLVARGVPEAHSHGIPAAGTTMVYGSEAPEREHDDTGKTEHAN